MAQEAQTPPITDTLDDAVVVNEHERQRKSSPLRIAIKPDVVDIMRAGATTVRLRLAEPQSEIRFRRESAARLPTKDVLRPMRLQPDMLTAGGGPLIRSVTLELAAGLQEADGLPALIPFGPRTSLVNIDYAALRNTDRATQINVTYGLHPQTRNCKSSFGFAADEGGVSNHYILLGDRMSDCERAVQSREGDLFFADGLPEQLRRELHEIYDPIYSHFASALGSEPGIIFVVWRPESTRSDVRLVPGWTRNSLLAFNGQGWEKGIDPQQKDALWLKFTAEQITRRLATPDAFTQSAVSYLLLLAEAERDHSTSRRLSTALPEWISGCARYLNDRSGTRKSPEAVYDCGRVLQFVYDAVAREKSKGEDTVYRNWRGQLTESYRRGKSGVEPQAFMGTSDDSQRIVRGLLDGSMDWARFVAEFDKFGVKLRIAPGQPVPAVEVLSLAYFRD